MLQLKNHCLNFTIKSVAYTLTKKCCLSYYSKTTSRKKSVAYFTSLQIKIQNKLWCKIKIQIINNSIIINIVNNINNYNNNIIIIIHNNININNMFIINNNNII